MNKYVQLWIIIAYGGSCNEERCLIFYKYDTNHDHLKELKKEIRGMIGEYCNIDYGMINLSDAKNLKQIFKEYEETKTTFRISGSMANTILMNYLDKVTTKYLIKMK
ncbi:MAG: hypothetical protein Hyperionvirus42_6 [Hyperionvirus sp.]|uniref:Uncharacterized protein n=1 Tax=Hyperionvirus sp. TaxID=2487770 RepID=A0A3G5ACD6_9VIRU|nr:MAG: hypothetical protein Hyperionvirus42_6 [Hyperionvirus sp.]